MARAFAWVLSMVLLSASLPAVPQDLAVVDRVVVRKGERRMTLMSNGKVLRTYRIALGANPVGHKQQEGDFRTPEGSYLLGRRNTSSSYFLSIQISYPNEKDLARAQRQGRSPGGSIMIHGLPNRLRYSPEYYEKTDWTNGCIAVTNSEMVEIWLMTQENTPIDILP